MSPYTTSAQVQEGSPMSKPTFFCVAFFILVCTPSLVRSDEESSEYKKQVEAAFADFEKKVETIRKETKTTNPNRVLPRLQMRRTLWKSRKGGYFERLHDGYWVERVPSGRAHIFSEPSRTDKYVELTRTDGNAICRLYEDRCDVLLKGKKGFKTFYRGKFVR